MKNVLIGFLISICFLSMSSSVDRSNTSFLHVIQTTNHLIDTVYYTKSQKVLSKYFTSKEDIVSFVKYTKTQSSRLDMDSWAVMKTLMNRMSSDNITWSEYYNNSSYNCSESIAKMKRNPQMISFDFCNDVDRGLFFRAIDASLGNYPEEIQRNIPQNVLYFESHPEEWNKNRKDYFSRDSIIVKYRHEFYKGRIKNSPERS